MNSLEPLLAQALAWPTSPPERQLWTWLDWLDQVEGRLAEGDASPVAKALNAERGRVAAAVEAVYAAVREDIRQGRRGLVARWLDAYRASTGPDPAEAEGFDALDEWLAGVLQLPAPGAPQRTLSAEMVAYQPTPARHVLDLLHRAALGADDVLVDIGAGLGQVPLLAALHGPARALGIEIEPTLVAAAQSAARALGLPRAQFHCQDVAEADLSTGTLFYLYTPLRGTLLAQLLAPLRAEAAHRPLRIGAFGPCVEIVAAESWLRPLGDVRRHRVSLFASA